MKKIGLLSLFSFFVFLFSCSKDYRTLDSIESISIVADASSKIIGETITFTVSTNNGTNITEEATIFVNGSPIDGNVFTTDIIGTYTVRAEYFTVLSEPLLVNFHDGSEVNFVKRVLVEDYTGTWCGNCPRVSHAVELARQQNEFIVPVGIHRSSSNPADANYDPYNYDTSSLEAVLNGSGYPKALLNRVTRWTPLEQNNIPQVIALTQGENPKLGVAMHATITNNTLNIDTKVKFSKNFQDLKLVVYVLENDLFYDQENYTNFFTGVNPIPNFKHDHVLKACLTPLFGEPIANTETTVGNTFSKTFNVPVPSTISNLNKIEFVVFVVGADNKAINVRKAVLNDNQSFEEL